MAQEITAQEIKFGTDGWRGIIADDFTFDNVRCVAGAIASYVLKYEDAQRGVFIGYDTRFASPRAAQIVAEVIAAAGIPVKLANDYTPTPAVSYAVKHQAGAGGCSRLGAVHRPVCLSNRRLDVTRLVRGHGNPTVLGRQSTSINASSAQPPV